jgi:hypothetical protein
MKVAIIEGGVMGGTCVNRGKGWHFYCKAPVDDCNQSDTGSVTNLTPPAGSVQPYATGACPPRRCSPRPGACAT